MLQAIRDAESRVMFTGYDPLRYKLTIWVISAVMCGVAGALYVPQVGIINPSEMSPAASIEMAVWAAVGGRATLVGPIVGAFFVNRDGDNLCADVVEGLNRAEPGRHLADDRVAPVDEGVEDQLQRLGAA